VAIEPDKALTIGEIARRLGAPIHCVEYIISSRGLKATLRAGHIRVFSEADVTYIEQVLRRIAEEHQGDRHE
jgi:DNA-binding transcriptional MerR regulator